MRRHSSVNSHDYYTNMSSSENQAQTNGTTGISSTDYFKSIGEHVNTPATNGGAQQNDDDDAKAVEEIESLCMNCHENVG